MSNSDSLDAFKTLGDLSNYRIKSTRMAFDSNFIEMKREIMEKVLDASTYSIIPMTAY